MSYETKAGVAVSCSFLCLVGVVLTSKLWEGQPANADTSPDSQQSAEVVGPVAPPVNGGMAPQSTLPNLQSPPTGENVLQQVKGPEAAHPHLDVEALFAKPGDPFQQPPLIAADSPQTPAGASNAVVPDFNSQPAAPPSVANQPASSAVPAVPLAAAEAGIADPKKAQDPKPADETGFAAMAAALKKKAAGGETIGNGVVDLAPKAGQSAAAVIPEVKVSLKVLMMLSWRRKRRRKRKLLLSTASQIPRKSRRHRQMTSASNSRSKRASNRLPPRTRPRRLPMPRTRHLPPRDNKQRTEPPT
jgi:hypothetical protein